MLTAYDMYYEDFISKGYSHLYAQKCAEIEVDKMRQMAHVNQATKINVPGVGECSYTGD